MKVFGQYIGGHLNPRLFAAGSYAAFDVAWIHIETFTGSSIEVDKRCLLEFGTSYIIANIKSKNGDFINPEKANAMIKDIATTDLLDLDKYDMGFFDVHDVRPDSICITNELDEDYNPIPLEVKNV